MKYDHDFWSAIDTLVSSGKIVIDRPKGSTHPRFPYIRYDVDYGYIENTTSIVQQKRRQKHPLMNEGAGGVDAGIARFLVCCFLFAVF